MLIHAESVWPMSAASVISKEVGTSSLLGGPNSKPNGWLRRALAHDELPVEPWIPSNEQEVRLMASSVKSEHMPKGHMTHEGTSTKT